VYFHEKTNGCELNKKHMSWSVTSLNSFQMRSARKTDKNSSQLCDVAMS